MTKFKITIMGDAWEVCLYTPKEYVRKFDDSSAAITCYNVDKKHRSLNFRRDDFCKATVVHEVGHAYFSYQCISSTDLDLHAFEEIMCEFIATKIEDIRKTANTIYRKIIKLGVRPL